MLAWLVFSRRLVWELKRNPLSELLEETRRSGARILDLTESNPTRAGLAYPGSEILKGLSNPGALRYDPDPRGLDSAREAVAQYYAGRGVEARPDRILLTASTSEAYAYLFKLLASPGDEVLIPRPSYPLFDFLAQLESVQVRQYPLRYDGAWHIDFHALEALIGPSTRALVVVNPNNPTGHFVKSGEASRLEALALQHDLALISDEVFADYAFAQDPRRETVMARGRTALSFSLSGLSKVAGLPQMKLGWMIASGDRAGEAMERLEWIADTYLSVSTPVQTALPKLLEIAEGIQNQIRERTWANLLVLRDILAGSPANPLHVEGGWYAVIQMPRTRSEEQWAMTLLGRHKVLAQPGYFFDFETEAFLVVSLLTPAAIFAEGLQRLRAIL
jgi:alanine-synthesizing transaminase